uniref:Ubiquitin-like domain-containing protein n=1 Tax=Amphiprion ocellaris TaxID=80972 RepID=A0AAQ5YGN5_AMPOC
MDQATSSQKNTSKMAFQVVVDIHGGQTLLIDLCDTEEQFKTITVLQLKEKICEHTGWPGNLITLKFITEKTLLNSTSLFIPSKMLLIKIIMIIMWMLRLSFGQAV